MKAHAMTVTAETIRARMPCPSCGELAVRPAWLNATSAWIGCFKCIGASVRSRAHRAQLSARYHAARARCAALYNARLHKHDEGEGR